MSPFSRSSKEDKRKEKEPKEKRKVRVWPWRKHGPNPNNSEPSLVTPSTSTAASVISVNSSVDVKQAQTPATSATLETPPAVASPSADAVAQEKTADVPTGPPAVATERDLWKEAFDKLPVSSQKKLQLDDSKSKTLVEQLKELEDEVKKKQEECERKFWKFRVGDHEFILRDYTSKILGTLKQIGGMVIDFAPAEAKLPWAVIEAAMKIPIYEASQMCALLASTEKITRAVKRGSVYEQFLGMESIQSNSSVSENLHSALVSLYVAILELLSESSDLFNKNTAQRTIHVIFHPSGTQGLFDEMSDLEAKLDREGLAAQGFLAQEGTKDAAEARRLLDLLQAPISRIDDRVGTMLESLRSFEQHQLLEWISKIPYRKFHDSVCDSRTAGTCQWLLEKEDFREWQEVGSSAILWLWGIPGAGKTFLTSKVIDHMEGVMQESSPDDGFAFFYCNRGDPERREPVAVLRSYVRQLSTTAQSPDLMRKDLSALCNKHRRQGGELSMTVCKEQILASLNLYPRTTIVLDALDECEPDSRSTLLDALEFLLLKAERPIKIFISSRPDGDIRQRFHSRSNIEIQAMDNQDDIETYVRAEIAKHRRWSRMKPDLKVQIAKTLLERSQGMFQWASLQCKQLLQLQTETAITERLGQLPQDLTAAYDEIWARITSRDNYERELAERTFKWIMCSDGRIQMTNILQAIRVDPSNGMVGSEEDEDVILELCDNLVVIDSQSHFWRFSHLSVREYIESHHWKLHHAQAHVAKVGLQLLTQDRLPLEEVRAQGTDIYQFALWEWIPFAEAQEGINPPDAALVGLLKRFLGSPMVPSEFYRNWNQAEGCLYPGYTTPAFFMARFELYTLLSDWWAEADMDLSIRTNEGDDLLSLAIWTNARNNIDALVRRGADVNQMVKLEYHDNAFTRAAYFDRLDVVQYLVSLGVDVNARLPGPYGSVLASAQAGRQLEVMTYLVEQGADVNMQLEGNHGSALVAATLSHSMEKVEFLVSKGAKTDMLVWEGPYGSALASAASREYEQDREIVEFLLSRGAPVNMKLRGRYGSALSAAVHTQQCYDSSVKTLIDHGADVNLQPLQGCADLRFGTPLIAAIVPKDPWQRRDHDVITTLLSMGADPNLPVSEGRYGSPLSAAVLTQADLKDNDPGWIVQALCQAGANVNAQLHVGGYGSALAAAANVGLVGPARALIEAGADVNLELESGEFKTALVAARGIVLPGRSTWDKDYAGWTKRGRTSESRDVEEVEQGKREVAELLLAHGAVDRNVGDQGAAKTT